MRVSNGLQAMIFFTFLIFEKTDMDGSSRNVDSTLF